MFLLRPGGRDANQPGPTAVGGAGMIATLKTEAAGNPDELTAQRLYSRYVARCVEGGVPVEYSAPEFYALLSEGIDVVASGAA